MTIRCCGKFTAAALKRHCWKPSSQPRNAQLPPVHNWCNSPVGRLVARFTRIGGMQADIKTARRRRTANARCITDVGKLVLLNSSKRMLFSNCLKRSFVGRLFACAPGH